MTLRAFGRAYAQLWALTLTAAVAVAVIPGAAPAARNAYGFQLRAHPGSPSQVLQIATANARVVATLLLAAVAVAAAPAVRPALDGVVTIAVAANSIVIGGAIGAYALNAMRWLPHLPLEYAALACGTAVYASARHGGPVRPASAPIALPSILAAAAAESYLTPQ